MNARDILLAFARKYKNDWEKIYDALQRKEVVENEWFFDIDNEKAITILDNEYPDRLKNTFKPPFVVYYDGDISLLKKNDLIYLIGNNVFDFKSNDIITTPTEWGKVCVGDKLKVWTDGSYEQNVKLSWSLAKKIAITKVIDRTEMLFFDANIETYVRPTQYKSLNNDLIKQGAFLLDSKEDVVIGGDV